MTLAFHRKALAFRRRFGALIATLAVPLAVAALLLVLQAAP